MNNQTDRQKRIAERRKNIRAKLAELTQDMDPVENTGVIVSSSVDQIAVSNAEKVVYDTLAGFRDKTSGFMTHVDGLRTRADKEALTIFNTDKESALIRRQTLANEKTACNKIDASFSMRWSTLMEKDTPEELAAGILELRRYTLEMLESKDRVVNAFEEYLATVDDDYIRLIREQSKEVDEVIVYMRKVLGELKNYSLTKIKECEDAFNEDRAAFIKEREAGLDKLRDEITAIENASLDARTKLAEEYNDNVALQVLQDYEEYTSLKRRLEAEGVALRQQLEEMRSVYQLNTDKLEYNYRLLAARDVESQNLMVQQKKKISKLQNQLTTLIARHTTIDSQLREENLDLSTSYKRMSNLYCDLQAKFKLFERVDTQKFRELWAYHERRIAESLRDLLLAEQIINESVLCVEAKKGINESSIEYSVMVMLKKLQHAAGVAEYDDTMTVTKDNSILDITRSIDPIASCSLGPVAASRLLTELAAEASFLASDDLLRIMAPGEELTPKMRTDALLSTLGIRNASELDLLFTHVTVNGKGFELLPRDKIVNSLRAFAAEVVVKREAGRQGETAAAGSSKKGGIWSNASLKTFWRELANLISPEKQVLWKALDDSLIQYKEILQARTDLVTHNDQLAAQNEELRSLLQQYISQERQALSVGGTMIVPEMNSTQPVSNAQPIRA